MSLRVPGLKLFLLVVLLALGWAAFTQHVWEDYYITYRASKNLATGHGLTFTVGERVHSFTSPLGVLLPALASLLTGNASDETALWIFRVMAAAALGGAAVIVARTVLRTAPAGWWAAALPVLLVITDAKTLDYTINGMETPFLLLFLAWTWWALAVSPPRAWVHLGLAWAGLMWTRPDAFVYIGALGIGAALFRPATGPWWRRVVVLGDYLRAGALTTALYLPWLVWAWRYYGTPVPNTVTAKGLFLPPFTPAVFAEWVTTFPQKLWADPSILAGTFMPAYSYVTGWPLLASHVAAGLALVAALLWLLPRLRWEAKVVSLAALAGQFYLYSCVGFATPWYLPPVAFLSLLALGLALGQLAGAAGGPALRIGVRLAGAALVVAAGGLALATAWQLRVQQRLIETGQRQVIGEWLKAQAKSPQDTVFLEPLGYIGFFSNLKMFDYPGLSSPEVIAARRQAESKSYPFCWSEIIMLLQPDWLVLRANERDYIRNRDEEVLSYYYEPAKTFDVRAQVDAVEFLPGRGYLTNDAYFEVWRRRPGLPGGVGVQRIKTAQLTQRDAWQPPYDSGLRLMAHAPSALAFAVPAGVRSLAGSFAILDDAHTNPPDVTDGARFRITHLGAGDVRTTLLDRVLDPVHEPGDRGLQAFRVELPADSTGRVELVIDQGPHGSNAFDWTYWSELRLETLRRP